MKTSPVKIWRKQKKVRELLGMRGKIVSWTQIHSPVVGMEPFTPYISALIELDNGTKVFGQIVGTKLQELKIGSVVKSVLRKNFENEPQSVIDYSAKFILVN